MAPPTALRQRLHESGATEHHKVLHDSETTEAGDGGGDLAGGRAEVRAQVVEDPPARRIGQRSEHEVESVWCFVHV